MKSAWILLMMFACAAACADESDAGTQAESTPTSLKLTSSRYFSSDGDHGWDLNLRANHGAHDGWLGIYRDAHDLQQVRAGYEYTQKLPATQVVWSSQIADGGFAGGSINAQFGGDTYALAGFGRTDLRPYYNLNFDPNDAITLGVGTQLRPGTDILFYHLWDDRLGTHQHVTHLYLHRVMSETERLSLDGSIKHGLDSSNDYVRGFSVTLTYARDACFVRFAYDQYANFGAAAQNRLSVGMLF